MKRVSVYYQELSKFAVARAEGKVVFDFPPLFPDVCQEQQNQSIFKDDHFSMLRVRQVQFFLGIFFPFSGRLSRRVLWGGFDS